MTNVELIYAEMELGDEHRWKLCYEIARLRRLESECRRHHRRLPHQVQTALRLESPAHELDPPPERGTSARLL